MIPSPSTEPTVVTPVGIFNVSPEGPTGEFYLSITEALAIDGVTLLCPPLLHYTCQECGREEASDTGEYLISVTIAQDQMRALCSDCVVRYAITPSKPEELPGYWVAFEKVRPCSDPGEIEASPYRFRLHPREPFHVLVAFDSAGIRRAEAMIAAGGGPRPARWQVLPTRQLMEISTLIVTPDESAQSWQWGRLQ